jgi:hypothetical protein
VLSTEVWRWKCIVTDLSISRLPKISGLDHEFDLLLRTRQRKLTSYQYQSPARLIRHEPLSLPIHSGDGLSYVVFSAAHAQRGLLKLAALRLDGICLVRVGLSLQGFIEMEALQHLQLMRCEGIDSFLEVLTQKCSARHSFALDHGQDEQHNNAIDNFVIATMLRRLISRTEQHGSSYNGAQGLIAFDTLSAFAHTIQCLVLGDSNSSYFVIDPQRKATSSADFQGLCKSLQNLKQLSVASPSIERTHWPNCGFLEFLVGTHTDTL